MTKLVVPTLGLFCKLYTSNGISKREVLNQGMWMYDADRARQTSLQNGVSIYTPASSVHELLSTYIDSSFDYQTGGIWYLAIGLICIFLGDYFYVFKYKFISMYNFLSQLPGASILYCTEHWPRPSGQTPSCRPWSPKACPLLGPSPQVQQKQEAQNAVCRFWIQEGGWLLTLPQDLWDFWLATGPLQALN